MWPTIPTPNESFFRFSFSTKLFSIFVCAYFYFPKIRKCRKCIRLEDRVEPSLWFGRKISQCKFATPDPPYPEHERALSESCNIVTKKKKQQQRIWNRFGIILLLREYYVTQSVQFAVDGSAIPPRRYIIEEKKTMRWCGDAVKIGMRKTNDICRARRWPCKASRKGKRATASATASAPNLWPVFLRRSQRT